MEQLQSIDDYCRKCKYDVPNRYKNGKLTLEQARGICSNCRCFGRKGIYKFDIVYNLIKTTDKLKQIQPPKGKKETYTKRYGKAVSNLKEEGKTVRETAEILGISPTSVIKILKKINKSVDTEKDGEFDE